MKILVVHNRYQYSGGEDAVVRDEVELLRRHGHSVDLLEEDNNAIYGLKGKLGASVAVFYSAASRRGMSKKLCEFQPEVVHVHNWFPLLSPSIAMEADAWGVPIVQTLHNYRMLCANALLYRDGKVCTDCLGKKLPLHGVTHACYRGSWAGSTVVTAAFSLHRLVRTWNCIDLFVAVSSFERELLVRGGLPAEKIVVKPNFVGRSPSKIERDAEDVAVFVGRLSREKGIRTMLSAWKTGRMPVGLKIIGDGPLADEVRLCASCNHGINYLGALPPDEVYREMAKAKFLVLPSEWFETFGRVAIEAFAQATPVLAADIGALPELVKDGVTGYRFPPGNVDALVAAACRFPTGEDYETMRLNCRSLFLEKYAAEANYRQLTDIYARAIALRSQRQQNR